MFLFITAFSITAFLLGLQALKNEGGKGKGEGKEEEKGKSIKRKRKRTKARFPPPSCCSTEIFTE